jgi:hypothetical protein
MCLLNSIEKPISNSFGGSPGIQLPGLLLWELEKEALMKRHIIDLKVGDVVKFFNTYYEIKVIESIVINNEDAIAITFIDTNMEQPYYYPIDTYMEVVE